MAAGGVRRLAVNASASGDNVILAGVPNARIKVLQFLLQAQAAANVKFRSNTTDLHPAFVLALNGFLQYGDLATEWEGSGLWTASGEDLRLNSSTTGPVVGFIVVMVN